MREAQDKHVEEQPHDEARPWQTALAKGPLINTRQASQHPTRDAYNPTRRTATIPSHQGKEHKSSTKTNRPNHNPFISTVIGKIRPNLATTTQRRTRVGRQNFATLIGLWIVVTMRLIHKGHTGPTEEEQGGASPRLMTALWIVSTVARAIGREISQHHRAHVTKIGSGARKITRMGYKVKKTRWKSASGSGSPRKPGEKEEQNADHNRSKKGKAKTTGKTSTETTTETEGTATAQIQEDTTRATASDPLRTVCKTRGTENNNDLHSAAENAGNDQ